MNNVETLANVAHICARGPEWFRTLGTEQSPGTVCCTVVGDVKYADVIEVELGTPLSAVLDAAGGPLPGRSFQAVISGVSNPVVTADQLDTPLSYEDFEAIGSGLGSAGFIVYDDSACMVEVAAMLSRFLWVESCGQCPPCKLGTGAITGALERIAGGRGGDRDLDIIAERLRVVTDGNRCYLPVEEQRVVSSLLRAFPGDFATHIETGRCPRPRTAPRAQDRRHQRRRRHLRPPPSHQTPRLDVRLTVLTTREAGFADPSLLRIGDGSHSFKTEGVAAGRMSTMTTTWDDVVKLAKELPEVEEATWFGTPSLKVAGKGFARLRSEAEGGLVLMCDLDEKAALLESGDPAFYTTPHYDGYGAILVDLDRVDRQHLVELITESWRIKAPAKLRKAFDASIRFCGELGPRNRPPASSEPDCERE